MKSKRLKISKKQKGFSLLEMIIAIFIFSLVIVVAVSTFVNMVSVRKKTREIQQNMENARVAMDTIAKQVRNNTLVIPSANNPTASNIRIYDSSQQLCVEYSFGAGNLKYSYLNSVADSVACGSAPIATFSNYNLLSGTVTAGYFGVTVSVPRSSIGRVTILMQIQNATGADKALVQTTVSLRSLSQEVNPS